MIAISPAIKKSSIILGNEIEDIIIRKKNFKKRIEIVEQCVEEIKNQKMQKIEVKKELNAYGNKRKSFSKNSNNEGMSYIEDDTFDRSKIYHNVTMKNELQDININKHKFNDKTYYNKAKLCLQNRLFFKRTFMLTKL